MNALPRPQPDVFMSVKQVAEYLHLNEKKIYALVGDGGIPATKVTGKWMFPRELVDRWMLDSAHGGLLTDRLVIAGGDDPLLHRLVLQIARDTGVHALISYTPTGIRLGLDLLQASRVDVSAIRWGPHSESGTRHPALLRQYGQHRNWVLIRALRRELGLLVAPPLLRYQGDPTQLFDTRFRWVLRQNGAGAQRFLMEILSRQGLNVGMLNSPITALSERESATALTLGSADVAPGVRATASEFQLGFVSFGWESFDFVLPRGIWFRRLFQELISGLQSNFALETAKALSGYDLTGAGQLLWGED